MEIHYGHLCIYSAREYGKRRRRRRRGECCVLFFLGCFGGEGKGSGRGRGSKVFL